MKKLRGVILAGGLGSRLLPLTKITNKHLLPVYDRPMIYYPIMAMVEAGIRDVIIVTGGNHAGEFLRLLGDGRQFGLKTLHYAYQEGEGGIAAALGLVQRFAKNDAVVVILGDNLFERSIRPYIREFKKQRRGARIVLKEVDYPERFGVARFQNGSIAAIEEKPKRPPSKMAVTGLYMYDNAVFDVIPKLKPSKRGELEITDVNNHYLQKGLLKHSIAQGWWADCGTFDSLYRTTLLVAKKKGVA